MGLLRRCTGPRYLTARAATARTMGPRAPGLPGDHAPRAARAPRHRPRPIAAVLHPRPRASGPPPGRHPELGRRALGAAGGPAVPTPAGAELLPEGFALRELPVP